MQSDNLLEEFTVPGFNNNFSTWKPNPKKEYPRGVYIAVPINPYDFNKIANELRGLINTIKPTDAHCTLVYSKTPVKKFRPLDSSKRFILYPDKEPFRIFGKGTKDSPYVLVIKCTSQDLTKLNNKYKKNFNLRESFSPYQSHITLSYSIERDLGISIHKHGVHKMQKLLNSLDINLPRRIETGFQYFQSLK